MMMMKKKIKYSTLVTGSTNFYDLIPFSCRDIMTDSNASNSVETQKEFFLRLANVVGDGLLCVSIAMGIETGLFQTMIDLKEEHKTSQEIADAGDFKERCP